MFIKTWKDWIIFRELSAESAAYTKGLGYLSHFQNISEVHGFHHHDLALDDIFEPTLSEARQTWLVDQLIGLKHVVNFDRIVLKSKQNKTFH